MMKNGVAGIQSGVVKYINSKRKGQRGSGAIADVAPEVLMEP